MAQHLKRIAVRLVVGIATLLCRLVVALLLLLAMLFICLLIPFAGTRVAGRLLARQAETLTDYPL